MRYKTDAGYRDVFLSNSDGHDVAVLQRLQRTEDRNGYRTDDPLSDEQWQGMVALVAAAPALLDRLRAMVSGAECECDKADPEHPLCDICWSRQVIARAEGVAK